MVGKFLIPNHLNGGIREISFCLGGEIPTSRTSLCDGIPRHCVFLFLRCLRQVIPPPSRNGFPQS